MPLKGYGVLSARAVDRRREGTAESPHYQVHLVDEDGTDYRAAVNVQSQESPSELLFLVNDDFRHPVTSELTALGAGWHALPPLPGGASLDYVRGNLFDPTSMRPLPPEVTGPDNDLADLLDHHVQRAIGDPSARVHLFGQRWGPEAGKPDKVFGFEPGNGVHDIHMNQGNSARFRKDDGVFQDGGLVLGFPGDGRFVAIFLAFQSQAFHTDDATGHALGDVPSTAPSGPGGEPSPVQIVAAMVNPIGPAPERETVLLLNASPSEVDLTGWRISDRQKNSCAVPAGTLAAGATLEAPVVDGAQLGNNGGTITLLDAKGLKVSGVSYTADQAHREGWTIVF